MKYILIFLFFISFSPAVDGTFNSIELISSKGEKVYINSLNWGVTDDYQNTAISTNKDKVKERADTIGTVKGFEPFFYSFKNDSLKLFFNDEVSYKLKESFKTINVSYQVLNDKEYRNVRQKSYINDGYSSIPKRKKIDYPSDMPQVPSK